MSRMRCCITQQARAALARWLGVPFLLRAELANLALGPELGWKGQDPDTARACGLTFFIAGHPWLDCPQTSIAPLACGTAARTVNTFSDSCNAIRSVAFPLPLHSVICHLQLLCI